MMKTEIASKTIGLVLVMAGLISNSLSGCGYNDIINSMEKPALPEGAIKLEASVKEVYGNANAIVTIISDDGIYDSCVNLDRIFGEKNLRCTAAGVVGFVEPHQDEWNELLRHGTIDLVSHSYHHVKMSEDSFIAQNIDDLKCEILDADRWYEDWLGYEQIVFVCPENEMCRNGYKILKENDFWAVRRGSRGYNPLSPKEGTQKGQWFNLKIQGICDEGVDTLARNNWIDTAVNDRMWLIEMWHNVMPEDDGGFQTILVSDAEEHLDYIVKKAAANDIWVATYDEAVKYIREKQNTDLRAYINGEKLYISAELTKAEMSYETFNHPLTVSVVLPDEYSLSKTDNIRQFENTLLLDIVPGEQIVISLIPSQT